MKETSTTLVAMTVFVRDFPERAWRRFKALCELEGKSVRKKLEEVLTEITAHLPEGSPQKKEEKEG